MKNFNLKQNIRKNLPATDLLYDKFGKLAEHIRSISKYRQCGRIFIGPSESLLQARINALLDQKELIMPTGGLKKGFISFKPNTIPFNKLGHAVTFQGMGKYGELIPSLRLAGCKIDLAVIDSEAVDLHGGRLGDGLGFSDLSVALLDVYGSFAEGGQLYSVIAKNRVVKDQLPSDAWDIRLDGIVTVDGINEFSHKEDCSRTISWLDLPKKRIRKIQPLWDLFREINPISKP